MLKPPGSSRAVGGSSNRYASSRRKTMESPTDQLRKIAKQHPSNKKCADCGAKLPQCVNLSVNSFICMTCAGLHREINSKIKSLGHSTFTDEEVATMSQTNNDKVNLVWLARFDPKNERSRLNQQPNGNQDQEHLRAWIRRKYKDKRWYSSDGTVAAGSQTNSARRGSVSSNQQPQATVVQIPPANPPTDLFGGFDAPAPAPVAAPSPQNGGWDAFGGSSQQPPQQQASNFGNFDNNQGTAPDPFAQPTPPQQQQQQQQNFANFGATDPFAKQPQQQPPAQNQNFANFGGQQQPPPQQQFANFGGQQPPPQQQNQNFANFGGQNTQQQQLQAGFANFNQQQQRQPPQQPVQQQMGGFANFNQQQDMTHQQQPQMGNQVPTGGGFANFNQQGQQQEQQQEPPAQTPGFTANFEQQQAAQTQPPVAQQGGGFAANFKQPSQQPEQFSQSQPPGSFSNMPPPVSDALPPQVQQLPQQQKPPTQSQPMAMPTMAAPKEDPMDAFAHLSVGGEKNNTGSTNPLSMNQPATNPDVAEMKPDDSSPVQYEAKDVVCYKSNGKRSKAQIVKKHLDDELTPYYTIVLPFGKEKQTDDAHLDRLDPAYEKIESTLLSLSTTQLKQVEDFLSKITAGASSISGSIPAAPVSSMQSPFVENAMTINQASANVPTNMGGTMNASASATTMMNKPSSNISAIPSPVLEAKPLVPSMGSIPDPKTGSQANNSGQTVQQPNAQQYQQQPQMQLPQMQMQQHPMQGQQPPQMQGQPGGQQLPQMQMQQQPMQGQQPPQMQGQPGGQQLPQMQMQQQPMQGQQPPQMQGQPGGQQLPQMQMQQQPMQGQHPPQMQGQPGGQQLPQMQMQQQPMQSQQPPQMQGQPGGQQLPQMQMQQQPMQSQQPPQIQAPTNGQPQMTMVQQAMQGQNLSQTVQAPSPAPQGNPFDMY